MGSSTREPVGPHGMSEGALSVALDRFTTDVGSGDALDLLISLYADLTLTQGSRSWTEPAAPVLEIAYYLATWDGTSDLAVSSMTYEPDPIFRFTREEETVTIAIADGTTFVTGRYELAAAVSSLVAEVAHATETHFQTTLAELRCEIETPTDKPSRWRIRRRPH